MKLVYNQSELKNSSISLAEEKKKKRPVSVSLKVNLSNPFFPLPFLPLSNPSHNLEIFALTINSTIPFQPTTIFPPL